MQQTTDTQRILDLFDEASEMFLHAETELISDILEQAFKRKPTAEEMSNIRKINFIQSQPESYYDLYYHTYHIGRISIDVHSHKVWFDPK